MRRVSIVWLLAGLLVLGGCGAPSPAAPSAAPPAASAQPGAAPAATAAPARLPLTLAYTALVASQSPSWLAQEAGIYDRYGLDVTMHYISSSQQSVAALLSGEVDAALPGAAGVVEPNLNGADLTIFAATKNHLTGRIMGRPEIASVADLRGKRVGMTRRGGNSHYMGIVTLARFGLEAERDVYFVAAGGSPELVAALTAGTIDAGALISPGDYEAERRGFKPLLDVTAMNVPYPAVQAAARRTVLATKEEVLWRYTRALADAVALYKADREWALRVIAEYSRVDDRAALEAAYEVERQVMVDDLRPNLDAVRAVMVEVALNNPRVNDTSPEDYVDMRLVDRLAGTR